MTRHPMCYCPPADPSSPAFDPCGWCEEGQWEPTEPCRLCGDPTAYDLCPSCQDAADQQAQKITLTTGRNPK